MSLSSSVIQRHQHMAEDLIDQTRRGDGLAPVDLDRFWAEQQIAIGDPFGRHVPQLPFGAATTGECVYEELGIAEDFWRYSHDEDWRLELNKAYNDKAQKIVGRRLLDEERCDPNLRYQSVKGLHDVFEAKNVWHDQSWWLAQSADTEDQLKALLDRVNRRDIRSFILPQDWEDQKQRLMNQGIRPPLYRSQRGPVTFATSIYGVENLLFLIMENPQLAARLRDMILRVMLEIARVMDQEAGYTPRTAPRDFSFLDDNCCLLNPEMYQMFGYPILKGIFDRYAPDPADRRYQHSDSDMAHLLPLLAKLNLTAVNFGPTVMADAIRRHLPRAVIHGVLAPFTYSRNEEEKIILELLRDYELTKGTCGLVFATGAVAPVPASEGTILGENLAFR